MHSKFLKPLWFDLLLRWIIIFLYIILVFIGIFMPLQTDEFNWPIFGHRAITDHLQIITLLPQCQDPTTFSKAMPTTWYPYAWVNHIIFMQIDNPLWIRVMGIIRFALFLVISWFIIKPAALGLNLNSRLLFFLFLATLGLNELPLLLQIDRPEQSFLLAVSIFIALALNAASIAKLSYIARSGALVLFLLVVALLFPGHPKTISALPIVIVCGAILFYKITQSKWQTTIVMLVVLYFAVNSVSVWLERYDCPNSLLSQENTALHKLPLEKISSAPHVFFLFSIVILVTALVTDFNLHLHMGSGAWLPLTIAPMSNWLLKINMVYAFMIWFLKVAMFGFCLYICTKTISRLLRRNAATIDSPLIIGTAIFITLVGVMLITGQGRMFYFASLEEPLLIFSFLFCLAAIDISKFTHRLHLVKYALIGLAIINMLFLICRYYPYITQPTSRENIVGQRAIMLSAWEYKTQKKNITEAYSACNLPELSKANHLVLDDYTYPVLKHSYEPFSFQYATNIYSGEKNYDNERFFKLMKQYGSSGIIMDCRYVPKDLKPYLSEHNGYCCANLSEIEAKGSR